MIVQLHNISKSYSIPGTDKQRNILNNISLEIESGQMVGIVGPSGSGKSTLLNIAGTLDKPDSGTLTLDGADTRSMNDRQLSEIRNRKIGFVFQLHYLLPQLSLLENVLLPLIPQNNKFMRKTAPKHAMDLLDLVGLKDKFTQRPGQLSVGECQRAALVRALINEPALLLADEPTGSLDRKSADQLGDLLIEINKQQGISMIVVTHSERLSLKMQLVYTLSEGILTSGQ